MLGVAPVTASKASPPEAPLRPPQLATLQANDQYVRCEPNSVGRQLGCVENRLFEITNSGRWDRVTLPDGVQCGLTTPGAAPFEAPPPIRKDVLMRGGYMSEASAEALLRQIDADKKNFETRAADIKAALDAGRPVTLASHEIVVDRDGGIKLGLDVPPIFPVSYMTSGDGATHKRKICFDPKLRPNIPFYVRIYSVDTSDGPVAVGIGYPCKNFTGINFVPLPGQGPVHQLPNKDTASLVVAGLAILFFVGPGLHRTRARKPKSEDDAQSGVRP